MSGLGSVSLRVLPSTRLSVTNKTRASALLASQGPKSSVQFSSSKYSRGAAAPLEPRPLQSYGKAVIE